MKIYIASSWKNEDSVKYLANLIREETPCSVDCFADASTRYVFSWREINVDRKKLNAKTFMQYNKVWEAFREDKKWLDWCDCCVLFLPAGKSSHLEAGYAKGRGKKMVIFSPDGFPTGEFDVMYGFANLITDDIDTLIDYLGEK